MFPHARDNTIYWAKTAEMINFNGKLINCNFPYFSINLSNSFQTCNPFLIHN